MKIDRLVSIIMILLDKKRIGAQELADMFEVSPRTIYRDIDAISMAGIPVCSISGVGGGFEIMREYKLDKRVFSTADLSAILMGAFQPFQRDARGCAGKRACEGQELCSCRPGKRYRIKSESASH